MYYTGIGHCSNRQCLYALANYQNENAKQYEILEYAISNMEQSLKEMRDYQLSLLTTSPDFETFCITENDNEQVLAKRRLFLDIIHAMGKNPGMSTVYICGSNPEMDMIVNYSSTPLGYNDKIRAFCQSIQVNEQSQGWQTLKMMNKSYFFNFEYTKSGYLCVFADIAQLCEDYGELIGHFQITDSLSGRLVFEYGMQQLDKNNCNIYEYPSLAVPYKLRSFLPKISLWSLTNIFQRMLIVFTLADIGLLPIFICILNKKYIRPLESLVAAMEDVQKENLTVSLSTENIPVEFSKVNQTFNKMVKEIKQLRIHVYEELLERKNLEIAQLQTQAKPHFYLNSLNVIYSMVQCNETTNAKKLIRHLADYCRFSMNTDQYLVEIQAELKFITSYVEIQKLRYEGRIQLEICCEENALHLSIPSMLLQEFVYNSFKYAFNMIDELYICVDIKKVGKMLCICITDNGPGYPSHVLTALAADKQELKKSGKHIGIRNTMRRIHFFYNGMGKISFSNRAEGGAKVDIFLPLEFRRGKYK